MDGCETMKCIDYKDGKCHYESSTCKYQESRMEEQEAKDSLFGAQQLIKELEAENKKLKDLYNTESLRAYIGRLKEAEDILKDFIRFCKDLYIPSDHDEKCMKLLVEKAQDYFKKDKE